MAKKSNGNTTNGRGNNGTSTSNVSRGKSRTAWINPTPNASDVEWLEANLADSATYVCQLIDDLEEAHSLQVVLDAYTGRWTARLFLNDGGDDQENTAIATRAATSFDALFSLAYFILVRYADGLPTNPGASGSRWG